MCYNNYKEGEIYMTLYTNGCFYSNIIQDKLNKSKMSFGVCRNLNIMEKKNINKLPILEIGGRQLNFTEANKFLDRKIKLNRRPIYERIKGN